ncbi:hypothetical protein ES705_27787 [subsurface metagenome]
MKTIVETLFLCGIIMFTAFSCEKNQEYNTFSIIGKWDWLGTISSYPNFPTEDNQMMAEYTKDSICRVFKNGELTSEDKFRTFNNSKIGYEHSNFKNLYNYEITNDSLIISDPDIRTIMYFNRSK